MRSRGRATHEIKKTTAEHAEPAENSKHLDSANSASSAVEISLLKTCDVLIVGGGPAGSTCAWQLRRAGADVIVMDAASFPRDKVCAGWITPQVVSELALDVDDYRRSRTFQPITGFRVGVVRGTRDIDTSYGATISYGIRRCEFDHYLLARSAARVEQGARVSQIRRDGNEWVINDRLRARMLVGAGGHFCPVARRMGASSGSTSTPGVVVAQEVEYPIDADAGAEHAASPERPELYFSRDLQGYGWCFRKGDYLNVGIGRLDHQSLPRAVAEFLEFLLKKKILARPPGCRWRGHAYAVYGSPRMQRIGEATLLVGDAAGLAYAESGEGIRPAVESGLFAAETIISARGSYARAALEPYEAQLRARFGENPADPPSTNLVPANLRTAMARVLLGLPVFVRHVVLDRWFLHNHLAPLRRSLA